MQLLFDVMWGMWLVFLSLCRYFSKPISMLTVALLYFGTNLWYYTLDQSGMSHAYSFFLFAVIVWMTPRFLEKPTHGKMILMALVMGLITVIRPVNLMLALYPLLFEVSSKEDFQRRMQLVWEQRDKWIWIPLMFFLVLLPQMYYWKIQYDSWLYYSYEDEWFYPLEITICHFFAFFEMEWDDHLQSFDDHTFVGGIVVDF